MTRPRVIAHRGASGHWPENSLAAFREAIRSHADGIELDVHVAASGQLIVHHDPEIRYLGPIARLDLPSLRRATLANGEPIPTLEEALGAIGETLQSGRNPKPAEVWIELKALPPRADPILFRTIDRAPPQVVCSVHSFDHGIIARLGRARANLPRGILFDSRPADPITALQAAGARVLWQEWRSINAELVVAVHAAGYEIIAWTVNDSAVAARLAGLGVDGLCGNWPERLRVG
ncbi:MAG: glycerophosphodiester phosphodiesterase [Gemmatimonadales bacterium]